MPRVKKTARRPISRTRLGGVTVTVGRCANRPGRVAMVVMRKDGKRIRIKYTETEGEAKRLADAWRIEVGNAGAAAAAAITDADKRALADFYQRVKDWKNPPTVADAFRQYFTDHEKAGKGALVTEAIENRIASLERQKLSERHIRDTRGRLARFEKDFGDRRLNSIRGEEITAWLGDLQLSPQSQRNFKTVINPLFKNAIRRKELDHSPMDIVEIEKTDDDEDPEIFTPGDVAKLLCYCPDTLRAILAIQFFAGLRRSEAMQLRWERIDFEAGTIQVTAGSAKTASRRLVTMTANLSKWLLPIVKTSGLLIASERSYDRQLKQVRIESGVTWKDNGARHSFISYLMAQKENASYVANQAGNSSAMIHKHYKALVGKKEADRYFSITPDAGEKVVLMPAAVEA